MRLFARSQTFLSVDPAAALLAALLPLLVALTGGAPAPILPRSEPEAQGVSSPGLVALVDALDTRVQHVHSLMVVRRGHVIAEGWWAPYEADTPHMLYSLTKSYTATAVGFAAEEGRLRLDDPVIRFFPAEAPAAPSENLRALRVRDLLTMTSGHAADMPLWVDTDTTWTMQYLAQPVPNRPGERFLYSSAASQMLAEIVRRTTGEDVGDYLRPRLFDPMGLAAPRWERDPWGHSIGGFGMLARTEEIAAFGELYRRGGVWNGRRVLSAEWAGAATARQVATPTDIPGDAAQGYGFQFWRGRHNSFRADGAWGQLSIVLPDRETVVAITAGTPASPLVQEIVWEKLLPSLADDALPADPNGLGRLRSRLAELRIPPPAGPLASPFVERVGGKWYAFPKNQRGIEALRLDFSADAATLRVRRAAGESELPIGHGRWIRTPGGFANHMETFLAVPAQPVVAAAGAWRTDNEFEVRLLLVEGPTRSRLLFRFGTERLVLESQWEAAIGVGAEPRLEGRPAGS